MRTAAILLFVGACASATFAQESAKVQATVQIPGKLDSFKGRQLEVLLYEFDPRLADAKATQIDKHLEKGFTHTAGQETSVEITLGAKAMTKPKMGYYITVFVLDDAGKRTHIGERDGKAGLCRVLTDGQPNKVTMIVRPVR